MCKAESLQQDPVFHLNAPAVAASVLQAMPASLAPSVAGMFKAEMSRCSKVLAS